MPVRRKVKWALRVAPLLAGLAFLVTPAAAVGPELAMLDGLQDGAWVLKINGPQGERRICVRTGRELIQLSHPQQACSRFVVEDTPGRVVVQYTCSGKGYGRTSIRKETSQLVQIDAQGIESDMPFHFTAEARRVGGC